MHTANNYRRQLRKKTETFLVCGVLVTGVLNPLNAYAAGLNEKVAEFDTLVNTGLVSVREFYSGLNDYERHAYLFTDVRFNPGDEIGTQKTVGDKTVKTYLVKRFSGPDMDARFTAIESLGSYASGLATIAAHDAPARTQAALESIGQSAGSIANSFASFQGKTSASFNYASLSGPISQIAALIGNWVVTGKRDKALRESINSGAEPFREAIKLLKKDIDNLNKDKDITAMDKLSDLLFYYNKKYLKKSIQDPEINSQRLSLLKEIESAAAMVAAIESADPTKLLDEIEKTHESIVAYANPEKLGKKERKEWERAAKQKMLSNLHILLQEVRKITEATAEIKKLSRN